MKKFYSVFLCLTIYLSAFGYDFEVGGIYYNIVGDSYVGVTSGEGYSGAITIPSSVTFEETTYNVTAIWDFAFYSCSGLTSVNIPNGVTTIGYYAFSWCENLTSVVIPNSVTFIEDGAFFGCSGLTSVSIPNSVTTIGESAFSGCDGLTSVSIPNSVTTIGESAFSGCDGLTSVSIPNSVTAIGIYAFAGCSSLASISVDAGNSNYDSRNSCNAIIETSTNKLIQGCMNTDMPNGVIAIGEGAFSDCSGLTSVVIPSSVTSIEEGAFFGCDNILDITCYATTPPTLQQYTFSDYNPTVYVPASSVSIYSAKAYWKNFYIQPIPGEGHVITVNSNDDQMGITMGSGTFEKNTSTQLIAITQAGYSFLQWNDGNTDNPRNVLVTSDSTFTAEFGVSGANDTIYLEYDGTSAMQYALEDYGVYYFNGKVYNSNNRYIKLYYSDGRLVSSGKKDIDMSMYVNGIYIVTDGKGGFLKINHYQNR